MRAGYSRYYRYNRYAPIFLLFILLLVLLYSFFGKTIDYNSIPSTSSNTLPNKICNDGEQSQCSDSLGCNGQRICIRGVWTGCTIKELCTPGSKTACVENFCSTGYKICNECGTGYSECIRPKIIKSNENATQIKNNSALIKNKTINETKEILQSQEKEISDFFNWSASHNIHIVAVNKSVNYFYYNGSKPDDFLDARGVPNLLQVANGLHKIPEDLLKAMNGKTLYLSYQRGRGYTILNSFPEQHILADMARGSIIEQPLTEQQVIHEFGHILDYHGIRGIYNDEENHWKNLDQKRARIFNVSFPYDPYVPTSQAGYMDVYSTANDAENFAQHFTFYILNGEDFRELAKNDTLLKEKYEFFKNELFHGREY